MNTKRFTHFAFAVIVGTLVGWMVANTYAPREIEREAMIYGKIKDDAPDGSSRYFVLVAVDGGMAIEVSAENYFLLPKASMLPGGMAPVIYTERVEWFTGRHYSWSVRFRPSPPPALPEW